MSLEDKVLKRVLDLKPCQKERDLISEMSNFRIDKTIARELLEVFEMDGFIERKKGRVYIR